MASGVIELNERERYSLIPGWVFLLASEVQNLLLRRSKYFDIKLDTVRINHKKFKIQYYLYTNLCS